MMLLLYRCEPDGDLKEAGIEMALLLLLPPLLLLLVLPLFVVKISSMNEM